MEAEARPIPTYPDLEGKVALVTGGSKGIGASCCRMLAANGARVAVNGLDEGDIKALVDELAASGAAAIGIRADCRAGAEVDAMRERAESELGPIDILILCAGGFGEFIPIDRYTEEAWREPVDGNLTATFLPVRSIVPSMIERRGGAIITISSSAGRLLDRTTTSAYAASKAATIQFTRHIALELGPHGIRANSIAPATVTSDRVLRIMDSETLAEIAGMSPLGRLGTPEDCGLAALFLASDSAAWLTGVTLDVAGGRTMV